MIVRAPRASDAAALASLFNAINSLDTGAPIVVMTPEIARRDLLGEAPRAMVFVAEVDGTLLGFVSGNLLYDSIRAGDAMFLNDLYVADGSRRRGIGRALVARLAAEAARVGAHCLWWGVDDGDDEAHRFYDALGAGDDGRFRGRILLGAGLQALARAGAG